MLLTKIQLGLLCLTAFLSGLSFKNPEHQRESNWCICMVMLTALAVTYALRVKKFDDRWFRCRAYAENFKSAVWLFVMSPSSNPDSEAIYLQEIEHLRQRLPDLQSEFAQFASAGSLFTDWMREAHSLDNPEKVALYRDLRLDDQIAWYSTKSADNNRLEGQWFAAVFCIEFLTIVAAGLQAIELLRFNPVSGIAALGTVTIAWAQTKRFSDLATSYAIASGDLQRISEANRNIVAQRDIDAFVGAVEMAVSREHSMWLARRLPHC